jgi:hypothetical protein
VTAAAAAAEEGSSQSAQEDTTQLLARSPTHVLRIGSVGEQQSSIKAVQPLLHLLPPCVLYLCALQVL